jgi:hypothetical protein
MATPGFGAETACYRSTASYRSVGRSAPAAGRLTAADATTLESEPLGYSCPSGASHCNCFGLLDCLACTVLEWPHDCRRF